MSDRIRLDQLDRELGEWLRDESWSAAPSGLVEDVFAQTTRTRQLRRWPRIGVRRPVRVASPAWALASGLGAAAVVVLLIGVVAFLRPAPTRPDIGASPSPSESPTPTPTPTLRPSETPRPEPTTLGSVPATRLSLGDDTAPIDVFEAFGSIWVANIHADEVRRYDPSTMEELERIDVPGAAWFAEADGGLWVTQQTSTGITRIDPGTNEIVRHIGDVPPCGAPVVAFDSIWQSACDANAIMRIDPVATEVAESIPLEGHGLLVSAGDRLVAAGPDGIAALDPTTHAWTELPNEDVRPSLVDYVASDGETVWTKDIVGLTRIDPASGRTLATFPYADARGMTFADGHAWITRADEILELDLATNTSVGSIPLPGGDIPFMADGVLWVTDFETSTLWRIEP